MLNNPTESNCPCGSGTPFSECCQPYLGGIAVAPTAEKLMRSRYTAFSVGAVDYLLDTLAPERRSPGEAKMLAQELRSTEWVKLEILDTFEGGPLHQKGQVEFNAHFKAADGRTGVLHERSNFRREGDKWIYVDGSVEVN